MFGGGVDFSELPLDRPIPESLLPDPSSVNRRRGRVEIFGKLASQGKTLRELIIASKDTGHWAAAGTPGTARGRDRGTIRRGRTRRHHAR